MLHDPDVYPNPFAFMPERYLRKDGTLDDALIKDVELGFGFGRRCVYRMLGVKSRINIFITIITEFAPEGILEAPLSGWLRSAS
jgi:hypothetical protein